MNVRVSGTTPPQIRAAVEWLMKLPSGEIPSAAVARSFVVIGTADET
jgi:hypothetical protein